MASAEHDGLVKLMEGSGLQFCLRIVKNQLIKQVPRFELEWTIGYIFATFVSYSIMIPYM